MQKQQNMYGLQVDADKSFVKKGLYFLFKLVTKSKLLFLFPPRWLQNPTYKQSDVQKPLLATIDVKGYCKYVSSCILIDVYFYKL